MSNFDQVMQPTISAVVMRADGTVVDLGVIDSHKNPEDEEVVSGVQRKDAKDGDRSY